jgi:hypothetical protein
MPKRIARLPIDLRGYPIPWFVPILPDGTPEFRAMDPKKWRAAIHARRCWVCGDPTGTYLAFVIGPMCGITRTTSEPPCHLDCATWAAVNCPFLSRPHMRRRGDDEPWIQESRANAAGIMVERNPGATAVWVTKSFSVFADPHGKPLITMGEPLHVDWYAEGRHATRAEVEASVESGYPLLLATIDKEQAHDRPAALQALEKMRVIFENYLPDPDPLPTCRMCGAGTIGFDEKGPLCIDCAVVVAARSGQ